MNAPTYYYVRRLQSGLTRFDDINGQPEIELGFRLAKQHWGCGLATEAATTVRDLAFGQFGVERLTALIDPKNYRSIRVAEKLGMVHIDDVMLPGYTYPDRVYSCMHELWPDGCLKGHVR